MGPSITRKATKASKHIVMQAPSNAESQYYNYYHTHSIVHLAACDADYCYTLLDIGNYGRTSVRECFLIFGLEML